MKKLNKAILAEGEVTGHAHRLAFGEVFETKSGERIFNTDKEVDLTHEEHKTISIPAGEYTSGIVREFDHFEMEARKVRD